jgi:hypothetical protein
MLLSLVHHVLFMSESDDMSSAVADMFGFFFFWQCKSQIPVQMPTWTWAP